MRASLFMMLLAVAACVEQPPKEVAPIADFEVVTERVVLYGRGRDEAELCGGSVEWLDRYIDALAPYYALPDGIVAEYYWYSDELFEQDGFCGSAGSCARLPGWSEGVPVVFSRQVPLEHEIVHALQMNSGGSCVPMLEEGIAEFLGGVNAAGDVPGPIAHLLDLSFTSKPSSRDYTPGDYARARHLVSFLVESYGLSTVLELCDAVPDGSSREGFDEAALILLGTDLDQLLVEYAEYPPCQSQIDRAKVFECSREPIVLVGGGEEVSFSMDASCAGSDAVGPRWGTYDISKQIRLLEDGLYAFEIEHVDALGDPDVLPVVNLRIEQCATCASNPTSLDVELDGATFGLDLESGDYTLTFGIPVTEIADASTTEITVHVVGF